MNAPLLIALLLLFLLLLLLLFSHPPAAARPLPALRAKTRDEVTCAQHICLFAISQKSTLSLFLPLAIDFAPRVSINTLFHLEGGVRLLTQTNGGNLRTWALTL